MGFLLFFEYLYPFEVEGAAAAEGDFDAVEEDFGDGFDDGFVVVLLLLLDFFFFPPPLDPPAPPKSASRLADAFCL